MSWSKSKEQISNRHLNKDKSHIFLTTLRAFISIHLAFNGMFDAVISHQSGTTLQVAGASPTAGDQTQEHFFFFPFSQLYT